MKTQVLPLSLLLLLLLCQAVATAKTETTFIRVACESTEYPETCYKSLSHQATAIRQSPFQLARISISTSLSKAKQAATYFSNISKEAFSYEKTSHYPSRERQALKICLEGFDDAIHQLQSSMDHMQHLEVGSAASERLRFCQIKNVVTSLSSAQMDLNSCMDGLEEIGVPDDDMPANSDVINCVSEVMEVTSNAIDLFNNFADKELIAMQFNSVSIPRIN